MMFQAIALFLERQSEVVAHWTWRVSEVQYADELLNLLDQRATPVEVFAKAKGFKRSLETEIERDRKR